MAAIITNSAVQELDRRKNNASNIEIASLIEVSNARIDQVLSGLVAFWKSSEVVSVEGFLTFSESAIDHLPGLISMHWFDNTGNLVHERVGTDGAWSSHTSELNGHLTEIILDSSANAAPTSSEPFRLPDGKTAVLFAAPAISEGVVVGHAAVIVTMDSLTDIASVASSNTEATTFLRTGNLLLSADGNFICQSEDNGKTEPTVYPSCQKGLLKAAGSVSSSTVYIGNAPWEVISVPTKGNFSWAMLSYCLLAALLAVIVAALWAYLKMERQLLNDAAEREKTFVSLVSHQLREPLTQISWGIDALLDDRHLDETHRSQIRDLQAMLRRSSKMVNDLLSLSRLERGVLRMDLEEVPLLTVIDDVMAAVGPIMKEREASMLTDVSPNLQVYGDRIKTGEAIRNILDNAVRYGPHGGLIELKGTAEGDDSVLTITDHGPGIPSELHDKLFDKTTAFRRQKDHKSSGLGLFLSKMYIETQGGKLSFESSHLGTVFRISLPSKANLNKS
jgi:signal transduction histidine kinase